MPITNKQKKKARDVARILAHLYPHAKVFLAHKNPWELLIAVILSAQCTDAMVNKVTAKLFKKYKTLNDYVNAKPAIFEHDIRSTGFYRQKTKNVLATAKIVKVKFKGKVPRTMEELTTLPGVGRKTANIILQSAFHTVVGIPVDTHVRRLVRLLGLSNNHDPDKIEKDIMTAFPKKEWSAISYRLISYGREYCPARAHDHAKCPLKKYDL